MSHSRRRRAIGVLSAVTLTIGGLGALPQAANAEPATPVAYRADSSATVARGLGFDTCTAPSLAALRAWYSSSYRTVNVYFGGISRACGQPNLTSTWVVEAARMSWRLLPTYVGRQPPCVIEARAYRYTASNATSYGASEASDAVAKARSLGMRGGSTLYADIEHYDRSEPSCITAVRRYVSAWTKTLHANGYLSGVYVHWNSGLRDLSASYYSTAYARPDAVWIARWDGDPALSGWPTAPNSQWSFHQRAKQYRGDHYETWSRVRLYIDSDSLDAPVATVALPYRVTSAASLNARSGPSTSYPDRRQEGRVHPGLGPLDQRRVGHRLLRLDAVEDDILCAAAKVQVPGTGHQFGNTQRAERPGHVLSQDWLPTSARCARLGRVPEGRDHSRDHERVESHG